MNAKWNIFAPKDRFASPEEAAFAEMQVDWQNPASSEANACTLSFAAWEIKDAFSRIGNTEAILCGLEQPATHDGAQIWIFSQDHRSGAPLPSHIRNAVIPAGDDPQAYTISMADTPEPVVVIVGNTRVGGLYGAYAFLGHLGCRWFGGEEEESVYPECLAIRRTDFPIQSSPSFETRGFVGNNRGGDDFLVWMARNRFNAWGLENPHLGKKLGIQFFSGDHDLWQLMLPPEKYSSEHPDWYGLVDGQRVFDLHVEKGVNICLSNADARREVAGNLIQSLLAGRERWADYFYLFGLDGGRWCQCQDCQAFGNATDKMIALAIDCHREWQIQAKKRSVQRPLKFLVAAYHETLPYPKLPLPNDFPFTEILVALFPIERCYAHSIFNRNCSANSIVVRAMGDWLQSRWAKNGAILMGEYFDVSTFAGMMVPLWSRIIEDLPAYYDSGVRHINYMHVVTRKQGGLAITNSAFAAVCWNTNINGRDLLDDIFLIRYPGLSKPIFALYQRLEEALKNCKAWKHYLATPYKESRALLPSSLENSSVASINYILRLDGLTADELFPTDHLAFDSRSAAGLPSMRDVLNEFEAVVQDWKMLKDQVKDERLRNRLTLETRRIAYTLNLYRFNFWLAAVRIAQAAGDPCPIDPITQLHACGELLRQETEMTRHNFTDNEHGFLTNGLTASWHPKTYSRLMLLAGFAKAADTGEDVSLA